MFSDGGSPSETLVRDWLNLIDMRFSSDPGSCVAVHCVAGLGRSVMTSRCQGVIFEHVFVQGTCIGSGRID